MTQLIVDTGMFDGKTATIGRLEHHIQKPRWVKFRRAVESLSHRSVLEPALDTRTMRDAGHDGQLIAIWPHKPEWSAQGAIRTLKTLAAALAKPQIGVVLDFSGEYNKAILAQAAAEATKELFTSLAEKFIPGAHRHYKGALYVAVKLIPDSSNDNNGMLYVEYWSHRYGPAYPHIRRLDEWSAFVEWPDGRHLPRFRRMEE